MMEVFTFFYGGPLSQWHPCTFALDGMTFNCAEQAMMWHKAMLFRDIASADKIMAAKHPASQKSIGRSVRPYVDETWRAVARSVVYRINAAKFAQNEALLDELLTTEGTIVEASPSDTIWGIGLAESDPRAQDRAQWRGTNWLGEVLTALRNDLAAVQATGGDVFDKAAILRVFRGSPR
jgi:ribA/ribD-fused uncharacterized protein